MSSVKELVKQNFAVIFINHHCLHSVQAKELLSHYFKDLRVYDVDRAENGEALRKEINEQYTGDKVPAIFLNGEFVGDLADLQALEKSGVLKMRIASWKKAYPTDFPQSPVNTVRTF